MGWGGEVMVDSSPIVQKIERQEILW